MRVFFYEEEKINLRRVCIIKNVHDRHSYNAFIDQFDFVNLYKNDSIVGNIVL